MISWLASSLIIVVAQAAAEPAPPASLWTADWGERFCTIATTSGDKATTLLLRTLPGSDHYSLWLVDRDWDDESIERLKAMTISFPPSVSRTIAPEFVEDMDAGRAVVSGRLTGEFLATFGDATAVHVERSGERVLEMPLQRTAAAAKALRDCEKEVLRDWGVDPETHFALRSPPIAKQIIASYFTFEDYPSRAVGTEASGAVVVRLDVGVDGRVAACTPVASSGHASLDERTCQVLTKRAEFAPAVGADGAAMRAATFAQIEWRIE